MTTFTIHTPESAPAESKALLESAQQNYGQIPNLYGVLAEAPIAVEAYDTLGSFRAEAMQTWRRATVV